MKPWDKQEKRVAKLVGGTRNAGSGSGWRRRQDVRTDRFLWEMKYTGKKQITLKAQDLEQLRKHALMDDRTPVMHIEVGERSYVVMSEDDFLELFGG